MKRTFKVWVVLNTRKAFVEAHLYHPVQEYLDYNNFTAERATLTLSTTRKPKRKGK